MVPMLFTYALLHVTSPGQSTPVTRFSPGYNFADAGQDLSQFNFHSTPAAPGTVAGPESV